MTITTGRGLAVTSPKLIYTEDGKRCYSYSGTITTANSSKTALEFQTKESNIKGKFEFMGGVNYNAGNLADGTIDAFRVSFNGVVIAIVKVDMSLEDMPTKETLTVLIPPVTPVKVEVLGSANAATELMTVTFTGIVYGRS